MFTLFPCSLKRERYFAYRKMLKPFSIIYVYMHMETHEIDSFYKEWESAYEKECRALLSEIVFELAYTEGKYTLEQLRAILAIIKPI